MTTYPQFDSHDQLMRETQQQGRPLTQVRRLAPADTQPLRFSKKVYGHVARTLGEQENRLLIHTRRLGLKRVVKLLEKREDFTATSPSEHYIEVITESAGVALFDTLYTQDSKAGKDKTPMGWQGVPLQLLNESKDYADLLHIPLALLGVFQGVLKALHEIHSNQIVHCDIKSDNLCLAYESTQTSAGALCVTPNFDQISLIDFGHGVWVANPMNPDLRRVLGENPEPVQSSLLVESIKQWNQDNAQTKQPPYNHQSLDQIDYSVDLYAAGYMFQQLMSWVSKGSSHFSLVRPWKHFWGELETITRELLEFDDGLTQGYSRAKLPHLGWINTLDQLINKQEQQALKLNQLQLLIGQTDTDFRATPTLPSVNITNLAQRVSNTSNITPAPNLVYEDKTANEQAARDKAIHDQEIEQARQQEAKAQALKAKQQAEQERLTKAQEEAKEQTRQAKLQQEQARKVQQEAQAELNRLKDQITQANLERERERAEAEKESANAQPSSLLENKPRKKFWIKLLTAGLAAYLMFTVIPVMYQSYQSTVETRKFEEAQAIYEQGVRYENGEGVTKSYDKALELYQEAADLGNANAIASLAEMYRYGRSVPRSTDKALELYQKAADLDNAGAMLGLGDMYKEGLGVPQDYAKAIDLFEQAADLGNANAMTKLGYMYRWGYGVTKDYAKAINLYEQAADLGDASAMYSLGFMYTQGQGVTQDYARAARLFQQAADLGNTDAMTKLGYMYTQGQGVTKDYAKAIDLYNQAIDLDDPWAMQDLGFMYEKGEGVPKNKKLAQEWYDKGCDAGGLCF